MTEFEEAVAIEPESDAWRLAWTLLGRDVPGGDTSGFAIAHARCMRDANGRRLLSVAFPARDGGTHAPGVLRCPGGRPPPEVVAAASLVRPFSRGWSGPLCRPKTCGARELHRTSGHAAMDVVEAAQHRVRDDAAAHRCWGRPRAGGRLQGEGPVRPVAVVEGHVLAEDVGEGRFAEDDDAVQALAAQRADHPFGDGVRLRRPDRRQLRNIGKNRWRKIRST